MVDKARQIKPELIVIGELFTGNFETDIKYVTTVVGCACKLCRFC